MELGIDNAEQGTKYKLPASVWTNFFNVDRSGKQPTFIGRYFSGNNFSWVAGELNGLINLSPSAASLRYVLPISNPGSYVTRDNNLWDAATVTPASWVTMLRGLKVNYAMQGQRQDSTLFEKSSDVEFRGKKHGLKTCDLIQKALDYIDPITGKPELVLPDSGLVFVFLDVEPQTWLHPAFWKGWAEAVYNYPMNFNGDLAYPLLPCLYCTCIQGDEINPGAPLESVFKTFSNVKIKPWDNKFYKSLPEPYALMSLIFNYQTTAKVIKMLKAGIKEIEEEWKLNAVCELSSPMFRKTIPLVVWQYLLNMALDNTGNSFYPKGDPTRIKETDMDFDATSPDDYDGRPITDFMLRRP